jgi:hypothetical protein
MKSEIGTRVRLSKTGVGLRMRENTMMCVGFNSVLFNDENAA